MWATQQRQRLPLSDDFLRAVEGTVDELPADLRAAPAAPEERAEVVHLAEDGDWLDLHRRFTSGSASNFAPWNRCLALLRDHAGSDEVTCVIEPQYVCLDFKSELVSFYAQLDQARQFTTTRLHFFRGRVDQGTLHRLSTGQQQSYLGYIVCRDGNLPLVGRAVLAAPNYIDTVATVVDKVHFFGQDLSVRGMPFMQQDSRFAVCAQVAVWAIHYAAFRSGLVSRRLVAEIVALSGAIEPMKPRLSDGLAIEDAALLHRNGGLSAQIVSTPNLGDIELPQIPLALIPAAQPVLTRIQDSEVGTTFEPRISADHDVALYSSDFALAVSDESFLSESGQASAQLVDTLMFHMFEPYLRSNTPIYAGTKDHAVVLCGLSERDGRQVFFVHDDQYGPYLASNTLMSASRDQLIYQGYDTLAYPDIKGAGEGDDVFPADRTRREVETGGTSSWVENDVDRAVHAFVIGGPTRLMLTPADAEGECLKLLPEAASEAAARHPTRPFRSTIVMGIDYKHARCGQLNDAGDDAGAAFYASLHLAEWVIVVEDNMSGPGTSEWEVVFDGSSSNQSPIVQFARFADELVASLPGNHGTFIGTVQSGTLPLLNPPDKVGKN